MQCLAVKLVLTIARQVSARGEEDIGMVEKRGGHGPLLRFYFLKRFVGFEFFLLRPDSPTVEASVVLFSLETLIITVSAGAVAALVVGFVTGFFIFDPLLIFMILLPPSLRPTSPS